MGAVTTCLALEPEILPPTERAMYYHSLRVHLQICQWKHLDLQCLKADEWGWHFDDRTLKPIKTNLEAAPESVLKFVRCKCKTTAKNVCVSEICSCRKHGLKCVAACGNCRGELCTNSVSSMDVDPVDDDFERNIFDIFS